VGFLAAGASALLASQRFAVNSLARTHSIIIRLANFQAQVQALTLKDWLIGRGFFVFPPTLDLPADLPVRTIETLTDPSLPYKHTAAFPDNFFLLLISFVGLPLAIAFTFYLVRLLQHYYRQHSPVFYFLLSWLINAQFNQAIFQPFLLLLFLLLVGYFYNLPQSKT
jgi:hypothetical protein